MQSIALSRDRFDRHGLSVLALLPAIIKATEKPAPSDEMFADVIRLAGLDLLSRLHIREGGCLGE